MTGFVMCGKPQFSGEWVKLGDVASYVNGYAFKPTDYASEGKPIIRIQDLTGNAYQTNRFAGSLDDKYRVVWGDVLISWSASLGVYVWSAEEAWLNQHIFKVQFNKLPVNKRFFIHQTRYVIAESASLAHGATMRHLTKKVFDNLPFFYPSEHDQEEIACHLDGIQLQIDSASDMLARLDALVKSRFNEMFGDIRANSKGLPIAVWRDVLVIKNGRNQKAVECSEGPYPICGSGGVMSRASSYITSADSVIIGRKGNINTPILMREPFWNVDTAFGVEPNEAHLTVEYLYWFCRWFDFNRLNKAVTIPSLTKADLYSIQMPLPDISSQKRFSAFACRVDKLRFILLGNPSPMFGHRSFCCSTNSGNGGVILEAKEY